MERQEKTTKKIDFRVQRTYITLTNALMEELKLKNFEDITVGELCERAMIRRATFYKHFGDKYELFAFAIRELMARFAADNQLRYDSRHPQTFYVAMIDHSLQFLEQNADIFTSVMKSNNAQMLLDILSVEMEKDILVHFRADEENGRTLPARPELLAAVMTGSLVYTMRWWIRHDMKMPRDELVDVYTSLIKIM